ncbi:hypothetical protein WSM22_31880 [Cytophagales bacterium WSM2-2]|nr:hypothetical protein WSM22_31880 [Cytophagales bacterium WSM2-2]
MASKSTLARLKIATVISYCWIYFGGSFLGGPLWLFIAAFFVVGDLKLLGIAIAITLSLTCFVYSAFNPYRKQDMFVLTALGVVLLLSVACFLFGSCGWLFLMTGGIFTVLLLTTLLFIYTSKEEKADENLPIDIQNEQPIKTNQQNRIFKTEISPPFPESMNHFEIWNANSYNGRFATLTQPVNITPELHFKLITGSFELTDFTEPVRFAASNKPLTDTMLTDTKLVVVSKRLREFLESLNIEGLHFISCEIGTTAGYFILQSKALLPLAECGNIDKSGFSMSLKHPGLMRVLFPSFSQDKEIPHPLFRIKEYPYYHLVRNDFAYQIEKKGFTGIKWGNFVNADKCWFVDNFG